MRPNEFRRADKLSTLYSFVSAPDRRSAIEIAVLAETDTLIGTYINGPDNFILLTVNGLHWIRDGIDRFIWYSSLSAVALPEDDQNRELKLSFHDGEILFLEIVNETEEYPDLYEVHAFLSPVVNWPLKRPLSDFGANVGSKDDLINFLRQENGLSFTHGTTIAALKDGFPQLWKLRELGINPSLLNEADTWRLLALFLAIYSSDEPWDDGLYAD